MHIDIVIPVLNEETYIRKCIESVLAFERPQDTKYRILVLDGGSVDDTKRVVNEISVQHPEVELYDNLGVIQSCALNMSIRKGKGDYLLRLDAHSSYPPDYLIKCLETAQRSGADNVGGVFVTLPGGETYGAKLVQALTTHRFGVGNSGFRLEAHEGPADTVAYGFFRRDIFQRVGMFDERLVRAQDYEMNSRIVKSGGTVWLNPHIRVYYRNQPSFSKFIKKQLQKEAPYNAYLWYVAPYAFVYRHAITALFAAGVIGGCVFAPFNTWIRWPFLAVMLLYSIMAIGSSVQQAVRYRNLLHLLLLPWCFFLYHFMHGVGVLYGLLRLATGTAPVQKIREPWPGAGRFRAWPPNGR
jgi:glycosyltransferase involved in cell wall biosynthesis